MKKNLVIINIDALDKVNSKLVAPITSKLDQGSLFRDFIIFMFYTAGVCALFGGILLTIFGLIGDNSFINQHISNEYIEDSHKVGAVIGMILGVLLSIVTAWYLYSIILKRTGQLKLEEYQGLLHYLYSKVAPRSITLAGELTFVLMIYIAILGLVATCVGSAAYAPLAGYGEIIVGVFPGIDLIPSERIDLVGNYDYFEDGIKSGILGLIFAFIVLIAFYIYKEIYLYIVKLAIIFISYLPKFAIPLSIRNKTIQ